MANTIIVKKGAGIPSPDSLQEAELALDVVDGSLYTKLNDGDIHQLNDGANAGGAGSSVHIDANPPASPEEGQQWMEVPASGEATMWVYDGAKWLQHPSGKDGAPGQNGADGNIADATEQGVVATWDDTARQWTPDSSLTIDSSGNATFSGDIGIGGEADNAPIYQRLHLHAGGTYGSQILMDNPSNRWGMSCFSGDPSQDEFTVYSFQYGGNVLVLDGITGTATFSEGLHSKYFFNATVGFGVRYGNKNNVKHFFPVDVDGNTLDGEADLGFDDTVVKKRWRNGYFTGSVTLRSGTAIGTRDLIETLHTLREATKDETTIKGLRDAIGNAVGGLIEKFEAMQSTATQEIADE